MKKFFLGLFTFAIALSIVSCKHNASPSNVAIDFAKSMLTRDTATSRKLATKESSELFQSNDMGNVPDSVIALFKAAAYTASDLKMMGDTAASVKITTTLSKEIFGQKENELTYFLKKQNGEWKVDLAATMQAAMQEMMSQQQAQQSSQMPADSALEPLPTKPDSAEK